MLYFKMIMFAFMGLTIGFVIGVRFNKLPSNVALNIVERSFMIGCSNMKVKNNQLDPSQLKRFSEVVGCIEESIRFREYIKGKGE